MARAKFKPASIAASVLAALTLVSCVGAADRGPGKSPQPVGTSPLAEATPARTPTPYRPDLPRTFATGSWRLFRSFDSLIQQVDLFVVGEVVSVEQGRRVRDVPTTNVQLLVTGVGKGTIREATVITVEQTGGVYRPTHAVQDAQGSIAPLPSDAPQGAEPYPRPAIPDVDMVLEVEDDPLLRIGERVALALVWKTKLGVYQLVNPQGRFAVGADGTVLPLRPDDPAVADLKGVGVDELLSRVSLVGGD